MEALHLEGVSVWDECRLDFALFHSHVTRRFGPCLMRPGRNFTASSSGAFGRSIARVPDCWNLAMRVQSWQLAWGLALQLELHNTIPSLGDTAVDTATRGLNTAPIDWRESRELL